LGNFSFFFYFLFLKNQLGTEETRTRCFPVLTFDLFLLKKFGKDYLAKLGLKSQK